MPPSAITFSFGDKLIVFVNFDKGIEICIGYVYDVISKYLFIIYSTTFFHNNSAFPISSG